MWLIDVLFPLVFGLRIPLDFFCSEETQAWGPLFGNTVQVMSSDGSNLMLNVITGLFRAFLGLIICGLLMPYSLWFLGSPGSLRSEDS